MTESQYQKLILENKVLNARINDMEQRIGTTNLKPKVVYRFEKLERRVAELEKWTSHFINFEDEQRKKDAPAVEHSDYCKQGQALGRTCTCGGFWKNGKPEAKAVCTCDPATLRTGFHLIGCPTRNKPEAKADDETFACDRCGVKRTRAEGGATFTLCDKCWDECYKPQPTTPLAEEQTLEDGIQSYLEYHEPPSKFKGLAKDIIKLVRSHSDPSKISIDRKVAEEWMKLGIENGKERHDNLYDAIRNALNK